MPKPDCTAAAPPHSTREQVRSSGSHIASHSRVCFVRSRTARRLGLLWKATVKVDRTFA